jgi:hypothetical protein
VRAFAAPQHPERGRQVVVFFLPATKRAGAPAAGNAEFCEIRRAGAIIQEILQLAGVCRATTGARFHRVRHRRSIRKPGHCCWNLCQNAFGYACQSFSDAGHQVCDMSVCLRDSWF